jgi:hypothetical protein
MKKLIAYAMIGVAVLFFAAMLAGCSGDGRQPGTQTVEPTRTVAQARQAQDAQFQEKLDYDATVIAQSK